MVYRFGTFRFDSAQGLLFRGESLVPLNQKSLRALSILLEHHGNLVTKEDLISAIWPDTFVEENNLSQCISNLRQALGDNQDTKRYVQTVVRKGFCFVAPVTVRDAESGDKRSGSGARDSQSGNRDPKHLAQGSGLEGRDPGTATRGSSLRDRDSGNGDQGPASDRIRPKEKEPEGGLGGHNSATLSDHAPAASIGHRNLQQAQVLTVGSAGPPFSRRAWRGALWIGFAACVVSLLSYIWWPLAQPQVLGFTQLTNDGSQKGVRQPLLTDGARIYFREKRGAGMVTVSVPVDGGEVAVTPLPPGFYAFDICKHGSEFIGSDITAAGLVSLATVQLPRKLLHWLTRAPGAEGNKTWIWGASSSPQRNRIVFASRNDIFEVHEDGTGVRSLAHLPGFPNWPDWSPDGSTLTFSLLEPKAEKYWLWKVNADGSRLHPLEFPGERFTETCCGDWTPGGKFFVFMARQSGRHDIWAIREARPLFWRDKPTPVRLTSGPLDFYCPLPSRDGKEIFAMGQESRGELMRFSLRSRTFADFLGGISGAEVDFSKDGHWVAYVTYPDYFLWRARVDGSDALQLTFPPIEAREPHWSPDGRQIAFQGVRAGSKYKIYLVPSSGGLIREAVPGSNEESVATWWPDGQSLLYDEPLYRRAPSQMFLHRLDLKTGKSYNIPGSAGMWTARLSPDGRYIAALDAKATADPHHLFILGTATGRRILTIAMLEQLHEPTWSRDGRYVYFATLDPPDPALYRVGVRDRKLEKIASLKGFPVAGLWTGVAPDGSPLLMRDISTEEIYALRVRLP